MRRLAYVVLAASVLMWSCGDAAGDGGGANTDAEQADLAASAVIRLVTVDNGFEGDAVPFAEIAIGTAVGGAADRSLDAEAKDLITSGLGVPVRFVDDADAEIASSGAGSGDKAVVVIEDLRIDGDAAEVEMRLWCGNVCGVYLTYGAGLGDDGWTITGPTGPIAAS